MVDAGDCTVVDVDQARISCEDIRRGDGFKSRGLLFFGGPLDLMVYRGHSLVDLETRIIGHRFNLLGEAFLLTSSLGLF